MNTSIQMERYQWVLPIVEKRLTYNETLKVCPHSRRSLERWISAYKKHGIDGLIPKSTQPKTQPNETPIRIKEEVVALRKKTGLCALKLYWRLKKQGMVGALFIKNFQVSPPCGGINNCVLVVSESLYGSRNVLHVHFEQFTRLSLCS